MQGGSTGAQPLGERAFSCNENLSRYPLPTPGFPARAHIALAMYKCALPCFGLTPSPGQTFARRPCLRPLCWLAGSPNRARVSPHCTLRPRCFALAGFAETQKCALPTGRASGAVFRGGLEPPRVTGSFPARGHPARAFPPRAPPGYLFSGDVEHAKAGWRYRVGTR